MSRSQEPKVHRNGPDGFQVEWKGVLLSIRLNNPHHGIMGSVAVKEDGELKLLEFHGESANKIFPMSVHEGACDEDEGNHG